MPWNTVGELPSDIQAKYTLEQQTVFLSAFNQAVGDGQDESTAFAIAHNAAGGAKGFKLLGNNRWIAWYTNPYEDRDGEYFAEQAIEADIAYMQKSGDYPELWFYHEPIRLGQADYAVKLERFAVAVGSVDDNPLAQKIVDYAVKQGYTLSHGFTYDPFQFKNNTYHNYHSYEISLVPHTEAANVLTKFDLEGKRMKAMNPKVREALAKALEGTTVSPEDLLDNAKQLSEQADASRGFKILCNTLLDLAENTKAAEIEVEDMVEAEEPTPEMSLRDLVKAMSDMKAAVDGLRMDMDKMRGIEAKAEEAMAEVKTLKEAQAGRAQSVQHSNINAAVADMFNYKLKQEEAANPISLFTAGLNITGGK